MKHPIQVLLAHHQKNNIYLGAGKNIYVINSKTGEKIANWSLPESSIIQQKDSMNDAPVIQCIGISSTYDLLFVSSNDKLLRIFDISEGLSLQNEKQCRKRPCIITVIDSLSKVFVSDKFGDVYSFSLNQESQTDINTSLLPPNLVLGHISMITDMVVTHDSKYLITSDRDEHIKISHLPNCVVIKGYCLGHHEFVSKLCILSWKHDILISGGGDPYLFIWNWEIQELLCKIDLINLFYEKIEYINKIGGNTCILEEKKIAIIGIQEIPQKKEIAVIIEKIPLLLIFGGLISKKPILSAIELLPGNPLSITLDKNNILWISLDNSNDDNVPVIYLFPRNEEIEKIEMEMNKTLVIEVDADYLQDSIKYKIDIVKQLERALQGKIKPMITQCCIQKLYETKQQDTISLAKTYERRRCNHKDSPLSPEDCIYSIVNINGKNKHRYVVATQSLDIRIRLRNIPGVPLSYISRSVLILEPSSFPTIKAKELQEQEKLGLKKEESKKILGSKRKQDEISLPKKKRRKGPREPNPLSVKKKKVRFVDYKPETQIVTEKSISFTEDLKKVKKTRRKSRGKLGKKSHNSTSKISDLETTNILNTLS
ncbi:hypothetical protein PMAC_000955 [Pneumocystis sp. 'macacae']|nr:hypothetical protein PMAC_000955 [Pneumocystis sp. 'macacae']